MGRLTLAGILVVLAAGATAPPARAQAPVNIGFMGDSDSDAYRGTDNRCGSTQYAQTTLNWIEIGVRAGVFDAGVWASYGEPRRRDYGRNWARSGATTASVISGGQHTRLAAQFPDVAILKIGINDFRAGKSLYEAVYNGTASQSTIVSSINTWVARQVTAINTVRQNGAIGWVMTWQLVPDANHQNPSGVARLQAVVNAVNAGLWNASGAHGFGIIDLANLLNTLAAKGYVQPNGTLLLGGETFTFTRGCEPHNLRLSDGHAGTVGNALILNLVLETTGYAPQLTDEQILQAAGL